MEPHPFLKEFLCNDKFYVDRLSLLQKQLGLFYNEQNILCVLYKKFQERKLPKKQ